ncbi:MAG: hypothetical protein ACREAS_00620, partial [Nitrososphaera sp.]
MTSRHYLDFNNKPIPFKIYLELPSITLPISFPTPEVNALSCISGTISQRSHHDTNGFTTTTKTSRNSNNSSNTP